MAGSVILDTHAVIFWQIKPGDLSKKAQSWLANPHVKILIPAVVLLEMQYLIEIGRLEVEMPDVLADLSTEPRVEILPFGFETALEAIATRGNRDPFDRMIIAHALALHLPILTRDRWMKKAAPKLAIW